MLMQSGISRLFFVLLVGMTTLLQGCAREVLFAHNDPVMGVLTCHRSPIVKEPATMAFLSGCELGAPAGVAIGLVWNFAVDVGLFHWESDKMNGIPAPPVWPPYLTGYVSGYAVGTPCWLMFGWWWPEAKVKEIKTNDQESDDRNRFKESEKPQ